MVEILSLETPGGNLIDAVAYSDYAALEAQLAERVKARSEPVQVYIDHADHTITTTLKDAIEDMKGFLAQGWDLQTEAHFMLALSALEATPPAPKVTERKDPVAIRAHAARVLERMNQTPYNPKRKLLATQHVNLTNEALRAEGWNEAITALQEGKE